jgi:hypothetical protein
MKKTAFIILFFGLLAGVSAQTKAKKNDEEKR